MPFLYFTGKVEYSDCNIPFSFTEPREMILGQPECHTRHQTPQDGQLIQQLPHHTESSVEVHGAYSHRGRHQGDNQHVLTDPLGVVFASY